MKKISVLLTAMLLVAGVALAQTPQTPAKSTTKTTTTTTTTKAATSTSTEKKDGKATCDPKTAKNCPSSKSCCSHGTTTAPAKEEAAPGKK